MIIEWRTLFLIILIWFIEIILYIFGGNLPWYIILPILTLCIAQQLSLQHEILHGHPTNIRLVNDILGWLQFGIIWNYQQFKRLHLIHHNDYNLTHPTKDPESFFNYLSDYEKKSWFSKKILMINQYIWGRMLLNPLLGGIHHYRQMFGHSKYWFNTACHFLVFAVFFMILARYNFPIEIFLIASYFAVSLISVRSFMEHRLHTDPNGRIIAVEDYGFWGQLFLNNNFHIVHHQHPKMPWYLIADEYKKNRTEYGQLNHGYVRQSYWQIFQNHIFTPAQGLIYEPNL